LLFVFAAAGTEQLSTYSLNSYSLNTTYQQTDYTLCTNDPTTTTTQITMPTSFTNTAKLVTRFIIITEAILEPDTGTTAYTKNTVGTTSNTVLTTDMAIETTNVAREQNTALTIRTVTET
ncbi:27038_t:CDS:1, partial [Racocetra persica]